jgi:hypothetical protein
MRWTRIPDQLQLSLLSVKLAVVDTMWWCAVILGWMTQKARLDELLELVADDPIATEKIMDAWRDIEHWLGFLADRGIDVDIAYDENAGRFAVHVAQQVKH